MRFAAPHWTTLLAVSVVCTWLAAALGACSQPSRTPLGDAGSDAKDAHGDAAPPFTIDRKTFPRLLNPTGAESAIFFAGTGDGCRRAKVPRPEQVPDLTGADVVPCPDALRDPAWNSCPLGTMFASADQKRCTCVAGEPSPHATEVGCPKATK